MAQTARQRNLAADTRACRPAWEILGWTVVVVAVVGRIAWSAWIAHAHPAAIASFDTPSYLGSARALLEEGRFSISVADDTPMFLRTPGYPLLLAGVLWLTGSEWALSPIQAALSGLTVLLVVLVGRCVVSPTTGLLAGVIVALSPLQFAFSGTLLSETAATLATVAVAAAGIPLFARSVDRAGWQHAAVLGMVVAASTMVRPTTYYLPLVIAVLLALRLRCRPLRPTVAVLVAFALPIVALVGGWQLRNHDQLGTWGVSGSAPVTIYCYHAAEVEAGSTGVSLADARRVLECPPGVWELDSICPSWWACSAAQPQADGPSWDQMSSRGMDILRDHPAETVEMALRGLAREVAGPGTENVRRFLHVGSSPLLAAALALWNVVLWGLAAVGAVVGLRSAQRWYWIFATTIIGYVLAVSAGANAGARFRVPVEPLLALLAAVGTRHLVRSWRARRAARAPALAAGCTRGDRSSQPSGGDGRCCRVRPGPP